MNSDSKRIAGIHLMDDGTAGAVWLAHDINTDLVTVYDACYFRQEVWAVIAEGLNARGRFIPIAWNDKAKDFSDKLLERGCNMLYEPVKASPAVSDVASRDIWERMRSGRFKVEKRLSEWLDEYKTYYKDGVDMPKESPPLMAATQYAIENLIYAKRQGRSIKTQNHPRVAIL